MRTLKKTLCLVLCLAMMAGLCVFASADFKDQDKIENEEAVAVLTGIGVIQGDDKGNFNPEGTLTRAEAATIITKVLDAADIKITTNKFTDVTADFWGMPYIAYCVGEGVVAGYGDGTFGPNDKLTGYQWATMLLRALGYEIAGEAWQIDVAKLVKETKMAAGITFDGTKNITRDDAAQMAFNAIQYSTKGETKEYVVKDGTKVLYRGTDAVTALLMKQSGSGYTLELETTSEGSIGNENFGLKKSSKTDAFGRTTKTWTNGEEPTSKDYVEYAAFAPVALETYHGSVKVSALAKDLGYTKTSQKFTYTEYKNSATGVEHKDVTRTSTDEIKGTTIEVYKTGADAYDVIVVDTNYAELDSSSILKATKADSKNDAQPARVWIDLNNNNKIDAGETFETDAFKAKDSVLYTVADNEIQSVEKAIVVSGKISKYTASTVTVADGETYTLATGVTVPTTDTFKETFVFYVDALNNVYAIETPTAATITADGVFYLMGYQIAVDGSAGDLFNDAVDTTVAVKAKVVGLNGKTEVIDVAVTEKKSGDETTYWFNNENAVETEIKKSAAYAEHKGWVAYTVEAGKYTFQELDAFNAEYMATNTAIDGDKKFESKLLSSSTTYSVIAYKDKTATVSTGYKNIKVAKDAGVLVVYADKDQTVVKQMYTMVDTVVATSANYGYAVKEGATVANGTEWTFFIDGEAKVIPVAKGVSITAGHAYDLTVTKGVVTAVKNDKDIKGATAEEVTFIDEDYFVTKTATWNFAAGCKIYDITVDGEVSVGTLEIEDKVVVVETASGSGKTALVYIVG